MKKITYNIMILLGLLLLTSCMFSPPIDEEYRGNLTISLNNRALINEAGDSLTFNLSVTCMETGFEYIGTFDDSNTVTIDKIRSGIYHIRVSATDGFNNYEGVVDKEIIFTPDKKDEIVQIFIDIKQTSMNGQIALDFSNVTLSPTSLFNVYVKDSSGNEVYKDENIKPSSIIENKYIVNHFFTKGNYSVSLTGGNVDKETYVVNENECLLVDEGIVVLFPLKVIPYSIYYVDEGSTSSIEDGSLTSPFKSFSKAIEKYNESKSAVQIILNSNVTVSSTIPLNNAIPLTISSQRAAKINSDAVIFENNSSLLTFKNISLLSTASSEIVLNGGSLNIGKDVYIEKYNIKDSFLKNSPILVEGDVQSRSGNITLILETLKNGTKVFNLCFNSLFDNTTVDVGSPYFVVDRSGTICEKKSEYTLTLNPIETFTNQTYEIKNGDVIIKNGKLDSVVTSPIFSGDNITITVFADLSDKRYSFTKNIVIEGNCEVTFTESEKKLYSGIINFLTNNAITIDDLPLTITLKNLNNEIYTHTVSELSPSPLNSVILPPDTYSITIEANHFLESYTAEDVILKEGETIDCPIIVNPSFVYYVSETGTESGNGTKENPFNSMTKVLTPEVLQSPEKESIIIMLDGTVTETATFDFTSPIDLTIQGVKGKTSVLRSPNITPYIILHHPQAHIALKNITTSENRPTTSDRNQKEIAPISMIQGVMSLHKDSLISTSGNNCYRAMSFDVTSEQAKQTEAILEIYDNAYPKSITLTRNAKIYLMNCIVAPSYTYKQSIATYGSRFYSGGGQILFSGKPGDFSPVETSYFRFRYPDNLAYCYTPDGCCTYSYNDTQKKIQEAIHSPDVEIKLNVNANTEEEITNLFKLLRQIPQDKIVDLKIDNYGYNAGYLDPTIWNKDGKGIDTIRSIELDDYITTIRDNTFINFKNLETIKLSKGITKLGSNIFNGCDKLTEIKIGDYITEIGKNAFGSSFTKLTLLHEHDQKYKIGEDKNNTISFTFSNPTENARLYKLNRGQKISQIYSYSVLQSTLRNLTSGSDGIIPTFELEIPYNEVSQDFYSSGPFNLKIVNTPRISRNYFSRMGSNLKEVTFDETLEQLPPNPFEGLDITFTIDPLNPNYQLTNQMLLNKKGDELLAYSGKNSPVIPSSVKRITPEAFKYSPISSATFEDDTKTWITERSHSTFVPKDCTPSDLARYISNDGVCQTIGIGEVEQLTTDAYNNGIRDLMINLNTTDAEVNGKPLSIFNYYYRGNVTLNLAPSTTLKKIPNRFVYQRTCITKVIFSHSIEEIGDEAFFEVKVKDYDIPGSITKYGINCLGTNDNNDPIAKVRFQNDTGLMNLNGDYLYAKAGEECGDKFRNLVATVPAFRGTNNTNAFTSAIEKNEPINPNSAGISNIMYCYDRMTENNIKVLLEKMKNYTKDFNLVLCSDSNNNTVNTLDNCFNGNAHLKKLVIPQVIDTISSNALVGTGLTSGNLSFQDTNRIWHVENDTTDQIDLSTATSDQVFTFFTRPDLSFTCLPTLKFDKVPEPGRFSIVVREKEYGSAIVTTPVEKQETSLPVLLKPLQNKKYLLEIIDNNNNRRTINRIYFDPSSTTLEFSLERKLVVGGSGATDIDNNGTKPFATITGALNVVQNTAFYDNYFPWEIQLDASNTYDVNKDNLITIDKPVTVKLKGVNGIATLKVDYRGGKAITINNSDAKLQLENILAKKYTPNSPSPIGDPINVIKGRLELLDNYSDDLFLGSYIVLNTEGVLYIKNFSAGPSVEIDEGHKSITPIIIGNDFFDFTTGKIDKFISLSISGSGTKIIEKLDGSTPNEYACLFDTIHYQNNYINENGILTPRVSLSYTIKDANGQSIPTLATDGYTLYVTNKIGATTYYDQNVSINSETGSVGLSPLLDYIVKVEDKSKKIVYQSEIKKGSIPSSITIKLPTK